MNLRTHLYRIYHDHLFWKVQDRRGGTFLTSNLKNLLLEDKETIKSRIETCEEIKEAPKGIDELEWDNLIILDACRHDIFEEVVGNKIDYRITKGSVSEEYVKENFSDGDWSDVVYVNGNPYLTDRKLEEITGRKNIFHEKFDTVNTGWSDQLTTVPPQEIVKDAKTAAKLFPEKRKILHFMQPHHRFLTESGKRVRKSSLYSYDLGNSGMKNRESIKQGYIENLEIALDNARKCASILSGRTLVTSDHGEFLGENGIYGHYYDNQCELLRKVPVYQLKTN